MPISPLWQNAFGANAAISGANPGPGLAADPPATGSGLMGLGAAGTPQGDAMQTFAASLLAGSGWSPTRQSGSEVFGRALLAAQQARAASMAAIQKQRLEEAQIAALTAKESPNPFGQIDTAKYTPESIAKFQNTGNYGALKPLETAGDTASYKDYLIAQKQGYPKSFFDYQIELATARANAAPVNLQNAERPTQGGGKQPGTFDPRTGVFSPQGPQIGPPPRQATEGDKKNAVLIDSMVNAEKEIQDLTNPMNQKTGQRQPNPDATDTSSRLNSALEAIPGIGKTLTTDDYRKYKAAGLRWAANLLYMKSGATANPSEIESTWQQFFPQPGDGPEVKAQKETARAQEIDSARKNMTVQSPAAPSGASKRIRVDAQGNVIGN